jgi:hypothetical protein
MALSSRPSGSAVPAAGAGIVTVGSAGVSDTVVCKSGGVAVSSAAARAGAAVVVAAGAWPVCDLCRELFIKRWADTVSLMMGMDVYKDKTVFVNPCDLSANKQLVTEYQA